MFLLRAYLVLILSMVDMNNKSWLINLIFPDPKVIALSAVSFIIPVLFVLLAWQQRRKPGATNLIRFVWKWGENCLFFFFFSFLFLGASVFDNHWHKLGWQIWLQLGGCAAVAIYLTRSKRVKDVFTDFPK